MAEDLGLSPARVFGAFSMAMSVSAMVGAWAGARRDHGHHPDWRLCKHDGLAPVRAHTGDMDLARDLPRRGDDPSVRGADASKDLLEELLKRCEWPRDLLADARLIKEFEIKPMERMPVMS